MDKAGRTRGEERLSRLQECFLGFTTDALENINRLTAACGELLGAACALYNRLDGELLCSIGQWSTPPDYDPVDRAEGHLCHDVIRNGTDEVLVIRNLPETPYARTDPNVSRYGLKTYIGRAVKFGGRYLGSLCAVYREDHAPTDDDRDLLGAIAAAIGVEEGRHRATEALRESKETIQALIEGSPLAIVTFDPEGRITSWNPAAERMFGWNATEAIGRFHPIVPENKRDEFLRFRDRAMRGEVFTDVEVTRRRKDGSPVDISFSTAPLTDSKGRITGIMSIISDVTHERRMEEQLRRAQKMEVVGRLAGGIAHDFNNLLTAVTGYSELLLSRVGESDPALRRDLEEIKKAGDRAASLTQQLLAFSRRQVLQPRVLDLNAAIADTEKMLRPLVGEDIELVTVLDPGLWRVKADPGQIDQVLTNLVVNARDAMPGGGRITIGTSNAVVGEMEVPRYVPAPPGPYVMLSVSDTGCGMDEEIRSHLFEPFFTTKEVGKGTGLGLSTVYGIVKQSGGYIWARSRPGLGSTFRICLPRVDEALPAAAAAGTEEGRVFPPGGRETVLLVEDEPMVRELVREILAGKGYPVLEASNGTEAILLCDGHPGPVHLLLTDVVMPGMSGKELARRLVKSRPEMKVIFMSGYAEEVIADQGVLDAGTAFIKKPFSPGVLARKIREVLDARWHRADGP